MLALIQEQRDLAVPIQVLAHKVATKGVKVHKTSLMRKFNNVYNKMGPMTPKCHGAHVFLVKVNSNSKCEIRENLIIDVIEFHVLSYILSDKPVYILYPSFLPRAVWMREEDLGADVPLYVLEVREFTPVVRGDCLHVPLVWQKHVHYSPCQWPGLLALRKPPHHHEICTALHKCQDHTLALAADDAVHLPVSEPLAVNLRRPHVNHLPVLDGGISA